jgi:hypothetical protein
MGRGLSTRILSNGLQSMLFTCVWKLLQERAKAAGRPQGGEEALLPAKPQLVPGPRLRTERPRGSVREGVDKAEGKGEEAARNGRRGGGVVR